MILPSRKYIDADGLNWFVAEMGQGDTVLLVHGTAASVHSWRNVMPLLSDQYHVVALDLPGHGHTIVNDNTHFTLPRMATGVAAVVEKMKLKPRIVVGHSAGAAVLAVACARRLMQPNTYISFNGAFYPFGGAAGSIFSPVAKLLAFNTFMPRILSSFATRTKVKKLLDDTGSNLNNEDVELYLDLFKQPSHISAALGMMASWDLRGMDDNFVRLTQDCVFVAGENDKAVPPETADRAAAHCRSAKTMHINGFGHLLHEEHPKMAAEIIKGTFNK
jgi:magnesium chelatase accessory protein